MENFHFETKPHSYKRTPVYRMINDVERVIPGTGKVIKAGEKGGFVQHTEALDRSDDLWVGENAIVLGGSKLKGGVAVDNAVIKDSKIHGSVQIGITTGGAEGCLPQRATITGSVIENDGSGVTVIEGSSFIDRAGISGPCRISGSAHIIGSKAVSSDVGGYAAVMKNSTLKACRAADSALVIGSELSNCVINENGRVQFTKVSDRRITGDDAWMQGKLISGTDKRIEAAKSRDVEL